MKLPMSLRARVLLLSFNLVVVSCGVGIVAAAEEKPDAQHENRLADETSPYLLLHAHNPVDWYPWGPEALAKAKKENKPIFLSVGYSSCYWCHVMERKVFSNPEIAKYMNEHFVNIKVDREERPDIDELYMTALRVYYQALGAPQAGGWPLSMFLTPDTKPLVGGTYFPPVNDGGRISFPELSEKVTSIWTDQREQAQANADFLTTHLKRAMKPRPVLKTVTLDRELLDGVAAAITADYDEQYGGFGFSVDNDQQPKFPTPTKLAYLQYQAAAHDDKAAAAMVNNTLDHMADGGIWDHLGGGFHRYSTDRYWHVPHFEKMLYDNAQLADIYVEAFAQTGNEKYRRVAEGIFDFIKRDMTAAEGGFYSAIDAESEAVEGKSYLWSVEEVNEVLPEADAKMFAMAYGLNDEPELEGRHVLRRVADTAEVAEEFGISVEEADQYLKNAQEKLLAVRDKRKTPLTDDKVMVDWNGLMIRALANAGAVLNRPDYIQSAETAADFILNSMRDPQGGLLHTYRDGKAKFAAYTDDYAFFIEGLLALHAATGKEKWLAEAQRLTDLQLELFWDKEQGGCYFTSLGHEELLARSKQTFDSARPSGNSITIRNLLRLAARTEDASYQEKAAQALEAFTPLLEQAPLGVTNMALGAAEYLDKPDLGIRKSGKQDQGAVTAGQPTILLASALQQKKKEPEIVTGKAYLSVDKLPPGKTCEVIVVLQIDDNWHINANPAGDEFALATEFTMKSKLKTKLSKVQYPKGKKMAVAGFEKPLSVYSKFAALRATLEVPAAAAGQKEELLLSVHYQACDDKRCLRPTKVELKVPIAVAREGEPVKKINQKLFAKKRKSKKRDDN
ncbi:Thiol:disulfide interchange protein DsbD [Symmachiella dynata]|uniref:thioredoxin domain-containing protein n=1 Tax=Symmachiella dynata TaxID=2527995 RepID=UPI001188BD49|nr:thioredoxin domain-containing protein [Symmachiella dynata]QDT47548.1 Thiol:disulfide interchange protein DsbD [Symmachiella dynata]